MVKMILNIHTDWSSNIYYITVALLKTCCPLNGIKGQEFFFIDDEDQIH